jgi:hypothetical protein
MIVQPQPDNRAEYVAPAILISLGPHQPAGPISA